MKKFLTLFSFLFCIILFSSCVSIPSPTRDRILTLNGFTVSEEDHGGVERWYAVDKYSNDDEVRIQVGYFKENNVGFILYENGSIGELANYSRRGMDLRWDWGSNGYGTNYKYAFVIEPDGTGLYYDFSTSQDGTAKPKGIYNVQKF